MKTFSLKLGLLFLLCNFFVLEKGISQNATESKYVQELTEANFFSTVGKGVVIVDFWAAWCRPCRTQSPIFEDAAKEMGKRVKFCKVDVDSNKNLSSRLKITSIPTLIIFKNGKEVGRLVGVSSKDYIIQELQKVL